MGNFSLESSLKIGVSSSISKMESSLLVAGLPQEVIKNARIATQNFYNKYIKSLVKEINDYNPAEIHKTDSNDNNGFKINRRAYSRDVYSIIIDESVLAEKMLEFINQYLSNYNPNAGYEYSGTPRS